MARTCPFHEDPTFKTCFSISGSRSTISFKNRAACRRRFCRLDVFSSTTANAAVKVRVWASESNAFIGGLNAALFFRPKIAGLMVPSAGYVFNRTGLIGSTGGAGVRIKTFRMEHLSSDRVEIDCAFDMHQMGPDLGFFFGNVISAA